MGAEWPAGAAYINGHYMPIGEATIPVTEWGYRRSDVTYDVVSVWDGAFFPSITICAASALRWSISA
jgi:hypothetical protein